MNIVTTQQAAYLLGMPVRTLNHHVKYDKAPKLTYDSFDPATLIQWYAEFLRAKLREAQAGTSERDARRRIAVAKATAAELGTARMIGQMVPVDEVLKIWERHINAAKVNLLAIPSRLAVQVLSCKTRVEANEIISKEIRSVLENLAAAGPGGLGPHDEPGSKARVRRRGVPRKPHKKGKSRAHGKRRKKHITDGSENTLQSRTDAR